MQLLCDYSEENDTKCLGLLPYKVRLFELKTLKIPHMGWNNISDLKGELASDGVGNEEHFVEAFTKGKADAGLAASIFHFQEISIPHLKNYLKERNIAVRI